MIKKETNKEDIKLYEKILRKMKLSNGSIVIWGFVKGVYREVICSSDKEEEKKKEIARKDR